MLSWESLIFRVDSVDTVLVDQEISVNGDCDYDWTIVENLLLNVGSFFGYTIVSDFEFFAFFGSSSAFFFSLSISRIIFSAFGIYKSVDFSVVKSTWNESRFAIRIDDFVTEYWSVSRKLRVIFRLALAPTIIDGADGSNRVWRRAVSLSSNRSSTAWILFSEVKSIWKNGGCVSSVAFIKLLLVWGLHVNGLFGFGQSESIV